MADEDKAFALDDAAIAETGRCIKKSFTLQTEECTLANLHHCILQSNIGQSDRITSWSSSTYNSTQKFLDSKDAFCTRKRL